MNIPAELKYATTHEWARLETDGTVSVGITDHAQQQLGDIVFVELPALGRTLAARAECAVVESVKAAADIYAPISGEVIAANTALSDSPQSLNQDAYATWLFRLNPADPAELRALLDARAYAGLLAGEEK